MFKKFFLLIFIAVVSCEKNNVFEQEATTAPLEVCEDGFAGIYPCKGYNLLSTLSLQDLDFSNSITINLKGNDSWGWTDTSNGKEYAIIGLNTGTSFVDISNPIEPIVIAFLPTATENSSWRDIKVYNNYAFVVSEAAGHGMQVFNLNTLKTISNPPQIVSADATYSGFGSAHNIVINEDKNYVYPVGTSRSGTYKGGPLFINIQDPLNPVDEGGFLNYSHDAQVVTYNGPDIEHQGKEILIGSNETEVVIVDITDKSNPIKLSAISYSNIGYTHQGWFTEDFKYFILGDELDELRKGLNTRTIILDFTDLDNPIHHFDYLGSSAAIDHNGYVHGETYYLANYTAGVRMIDISDIENKTITEIGFFDTYPDDNSTNFEGVWSVYPYFSSNNIVVSDINSGLFILRKSGI